MNSLKIYVLTILHVTAQYIEVLIVTLDLMFIILSVLRVHVNRNHEIYYSLNSH